MTGKRMDRAGVRNIVGGVDADSGEERIRAREAAENHAVALLDQYAGDMSEEQARELCEYFSRDFHRGQERRNRFSPAFVGSHVQKLVSDMDAFNDLTRRMWRGSIDEGLAAVDEVLRASATLPGAGRSYATIIPYLRDPERFAIWLDSTDRGVRNALGSPKRNRRQGLSGYLPFCEDAHRFGAEFDVHPRMLDAHLASVARGDSVRGAGATHASPRGPGVEETAALSPPPVASTEALADYLLTPVDIVEEWVALVTEHPRKAQALLYGPPGTGKTFIASALAAHLAGEDGVVQTLQFHPAYSYEDFMEGLRPSVGGGTLSYDIKPGAFQQLCDLARKISPARVVVIADEINRADLAAVLGELLYLLEYRGKEVELPYSRKMFSVPPNVVLLGTMNTADRSLALVDFALRRRFHAIRVPPNRDVLERWHGDRDGDGELAVQLFDLVQEAVGAWEAAPGHSYFMEDPSAAGLMRVWEYELRPYLAEYWADRGEGLHRLDGEVAELLGGA